MPTYDYQHLELSENQCTLGHKFEIFESIRVTPRTLCEVCGKAVQRLLGTGCGVIIK